MKVIVCGAGQVGANIARQLSAENNDVTVVDQSPELIQRLGDSLDVKPMVGFASRPNVLAAAGAADADLLIAATVSDEVNMVACQVAHSIFNVQTKIARIREQSYMSEKWANLFSRDHLPIDVIISPEVEVAKAVMRRLSAPGASEMIPLVDGRIRVVGVRLTDNCPVINTPLRQIAALFPDLNINVIGIVRDDRSFVPGADDQMFPRDEVFFVVEAGHVTRALSVFGHEEPEAHRVVVVGGGNIGLALAQRMESETPGISARVIEHSGTRAADIAQMLTRTMVLNGDALDPELLDEANVREVDTLISVTNDDETNILVSLLAKRYGAKRTVALINKPFYSSLISPLDIDVFLNPRSITVSTILQHVRRGRIRALHSIGDNFGEIIEVEALETSSIVGVPIRDVKVPPGAIIGAVAREDEIVIPRGDTMIRAHDRVVVFSMESVIRKVEKMFAVKLEYF